MFSDEQIHLYNLFNKDCLPDDYYIFKQMFFI